MPILSAFTESRRSRLVDDVPDVADAGVRVFEEMRLAAADALVGGVVADDSVVADDREGVVGECLA